jgi:hypothetical protein
MIIHIFGTLAHACLPDSRLTHPIFDSPLGARRTYCHCWMRTLSASVLSVRPSFKCAGYQVGAPCNTCNLTCNSPLTSIWQAHERSDQRAEGAALESSAPL